MNQTNNDLLAKAIWHSRIKKYIFNKEVKTKNNNFNKKVWVNSKNIKPKRNLKLKNKFTQIFYILSFVSHLKYKLKLLKKLKIYNVLPKLFLKQEIKR